MDEQATPRPWQRSATDDGYWEVRSHGDGIERALVEHVALLPLERDAQLVTDAVNAYYRLRNVERAARNLSDRRTADSDGYWVSKKEMWALDDALGAKS